MNVEGGCAENASQLRLGFRSMIGLYSGRREARVPAEVYFLLSTLKYSKNFKVLFNFFLTESVKGLPFI